MTKQRRRLLIVAGIAAAVLLLVAAALIFDLMRKQRKLIAARDQGLAAFSQGKYDEAYSKLAIYLRPMGNRKDPDVVYKFALSHKLASDSSREHTELAKNWFQLHLSLKPDSIETWKHLVEIFPRLGRVTEALDATERVIAVEPGNIIALKTRIECQMLLGRAGEALKSAEKLAAAAPDDIENSIRILVLLRSQGRTAEILPRASKAWNENPNTAATEILMSVACSLVDDFSPQQRSEAWAMAEKIDPDRSIRKRRNPNEGADTFGNYAAAVCFARKAASRVIGDLVVTRAIVSQLDRLGLIFDSLALLERIDPAIDDRWVRGPLILRLWECNRFEQVNRRLDKFSPQHKTPEEMELLAVRAAALIQSDQREQGIKVVDELAQFKNDRVAMAWEAILRQQYLGGARGRAGARRQRGH